jgi:uncharacterized protein
MEILVQYGKEYWDVIRHNMKIDEKENAKAEREKLKKTSGAKAVNGSRVKQTGGKVLGKKK